MPRHLLAAGILGVVLSVAGCSPAGSATPAVPICVASTEAAAVDVSIVDFSFGDLPITVNRGQVLGFTNDGFESHNATLDDGSCKTATLEHEQTGSLLFNVAGSYPFHCTVHTQMVGTITVR